MAQSIHGVSQFLLDNPLLSQKWNNQYIVSLSVKTEEKLKNLLEKLNDTDTSVSYFCEPDLNDELTSICFYETEKTKKLTSNLPLSLKYI